MSERDLMLQAVREGRCDPLIFADWLEGHDDPRCGWVRKAVGETAGEALVARVALMFRPLLTRAKLEAMGPPTDALEIVVAAGQATLPVVYEPGAWQTIPPIGEVVALHADADGDLFADLRLSDGWPPSSYGGLLAGSLLTSCEVGRGAGGAELRRVALLPRFDARWAMQPPPLTEEELEAVVRRQVEAEPGRLDLPAPLQRLPQMPQRHISHMIALCQCQDRPPLTLPAGPPTLESLTLARVELRRGDVRWEEFADDRRVVREVAFWIGQCPACRVVWWAATEYGPSPLRDFRLLQEQMGIHPAADAHRVSLLGDGRPVFDPRQFIIPND